MHLAFELCNGDFFSVAKLPTVAKLQSTTQDLIGRHAQTFPCNESLHMLWCKRKVLHRPMSRQRRWRGRRMSFGMFIYKIKTDTFRQALLQRSLLQAGVQVVYLFKT